MSTRKISHVAMVGAGLAGAACAHALAQAGCQVEVFDKSRGPGGRLATRRFEFKDRQGLAQMAPLDHGAIGFTARTPAFQRFIEQALAAGWLAPWAPPAASAGLPLRLEVPIYVPVPNQPALCRHLLESAVCHWSAPIEALHKTAEGWALQIEGQTSSQRFDSVLLATPAAQAAPLLKPHRADWAQQASQAEMQACWTLMGVADAPVPEVAAQIARPSSGPLAWVIRQDSRPGREAAPGLAHWVAHARPDWSHHHLEQAAEWVQAELQAALAQWLGQPIHWLGSTVHRWRYAMPATTPLAGDGQSASAAETPGAPAQTSLWWDPVQALGVCGDFLGQAGLEGAWASGQALALAILQPAELAAATASTTASGSAPSERQP